MNAAQLNEIISNVDKLRECFASVGSHGLASDMRDAMMALMDKRDAIKKKEATCETCGKAKD